MFRSLCNGRCFLQVFGYMPLLLLSLCFFLLYFIYLYTYLIPKIISAPFVNDLDYLLFPGNEKIEYDSKFLVLFVMFHILLFLFLFSLLKTIFSAPGYVSVECSNKIAINAIKEFKIMMNRYNDMKDSSKKNQFSGFFRENEPENGKKELIEEINSPPLFNFAEMIEKKIYLDARKNILDTISMLSIDEEKFCLFVKEHNYRLCSTCNTFKPLRSGHCPECNICVLKMDHHCEWLQTCIGLRNYKFFIVMIFYGNCFFQFMVTSYVKFAWDAVFNATVSLWSSYFILMVFLIMVVINLRFIGLLILHIFLISTGRTSREFLKNQKSSQTRRYDLGYLQNIREVLGENILLWFLPL